MRYTIRQAFFSIGPHYIITDERGAVMYNLRSRRLLSSKEGWVEDWQGNRLAEITVNTTFWGTIRIYSIKNAAGEVATVREAPVTMFRPRYTIEVPGATGLEAIGAWGRRRLTFKRNREVVAHMSRPWFAFRDQCRVETSDESVLLIVVTCSIIYWDYYHRYLL